MKMLTPIVEQYFADKDQLMLHTAITTNESGGYYNAIFKTKDKQARKDYDTAHGVVSMITSENKTIVIHYLDSKRGRHLVGKENNEAYIKKDFAKFKKSYKASDYNWS